MKTEIITLKITVSDDYDYPKNWDWSGILDLGHEEQVEVLAYENAMEE
jgi:hypothetical protein